MWPAFIRGIEDNLPNAKITFDRFHIMKVIHTVVNTVRKQKASNHAVLKGTKYIFKEQEKLNGCSTQKVRRIVDITLELEGHKNSAHLGKLSGNL